MMEEDKNVEATKPYDHVFGVNLNVDINISDDERAISALYALQKKKANKNEYLDSKLMAQIDSFSMYDVVVEILQRLQEENVCPAVPITAETRLEELFPAKGRERNWKRFIRDLQSQDWDTGRAEFLRMPRSVSKFTSPFNVAFVVILVLSIPIGILNAFNVIECFPQCLRFAIFWICQFLYFYLGIYILIYFILDYLPFRFYTNVFKKEYDTVEKLSRYLKEINLFRITDPDAETLAKSGCPICKKILDFLSCQSRIPENELNLQTRLDSLFQGNKAYSVWNGLLEEMTKEKFNLPYMIPLLLSSSSVIIKWFLNFLSWFVAAGFAIGVGYVVYFSSFNISAPRDYLIDRIPFLTNCLYMWMLFSLVFVNLLLAATLIMAIVAMFDYFLFPRYSFPVRYQTIANLVNRFRAANVEWLAENCLESLDVKLRTLAFPNAEQKEVIEKLKSEQEKEEDELEEF